MRKRFLGLVAAVMAAALLLTACATTSQPSQSGNQPTAPAAPKNFYGAWPYDVPPKSHFNVFATGNLSMPGSPYTPLMTSPLAMQYWATDTWEPLLATSWNMNNAAGTITVNLRKGVKWSDGSEFKAADVINTLSIGKAKSYAIWRYLDTVTAKDDYTLEFNLKNPAPIALRYVLKTVPFPTSVYGDWAKKFDALWAAGKAATSDEAKALAKDLDAFRPSDYVANGPFKMDTQTITEAQLTLVKRPDAWNAATVKFDKIVIYNGETAAVTPLVLDKKVDFATHAFPIATEKQIISQGIRVIRYPFYTGPALHFNHSVYPNNLVEFRQALAYAINRSEAGAVALGQSSVPVKRMAGISDQWVDNWIPSAYASKLNPYSHNPAKAEELLKSIKFAKGSDGFWMDDKGKRIEIELAVPSDFADWSATAENVSQQLNKFGLKTVVRGVPWAQHNATDIPTGKFQIGFMPWGSGTPHPQFSYERNLVLWNGGGATGNKEKPGSNFSLKVKYSGGEVDLNQLITESGAGLDVSKHKEALGKIALASNELMPIIPLWERYSNSPALENTHVKGWPKDSDPILANGGEDNFVTIMLLKGQLEPAK